LPESTTPPSTPPDDDVEAELDDTLEDEEPPDDALADEEPPDDALEDEEPPDDALEDEEPPDDTAAETLAPDEAPFDAAEVEPGSPDDDEPAVPVVLVGSHPHMRVATNTATLDVLFTGTPI
jgi:hypothetical protein